MMYTLLEGLYRLVILLYPRAFRLRYADELLHDFRERGRLESSRKGALGGLLFWTRSLAMSRCEAAYFTASGNPKEVIIIV